MTRLRKPINHSPPSWLKPEDEIFFLTICCEQRGGNLLAHLEIATKLLESAAFRNNSQTWHAFLFLVMPDHIHALIAFPDDKEISKIISDWKRWHCRMNGINWQRGFFEHRLRREEGFLQKSDYILQNPVRAGLAEESGRLAISMDRGERGLMRPSQLSELPLPHQAATERYGQHALLPRRLGEPPLPIYLGRTLKW